MKLEEKEILRKKRVLVYAEACGNVLKTCRHFGGDCRKFCAEAGLVIEC